MADPKLLELNTRKLQLTRDARDAVELDVDMALRSNNPAAAACAVERMRAWAEARALTKPVSSMQALYERNLFALAFALIAIKIEKLAGGEQIASIKPWLESLASDHIDAYRRFTGVRNNLFYWAGASAAAVDLFVNSSKLSKFASEVWDEAMNAAKPDGSFPKELQRGQLSLTYQVYATDALIILKFLREAKQAHLDKQETWTRIIKFTTTSLCRPEIIGQMIGVPQELVTGKALVPLHVFHETVESEALAGCPPKPRNDIFEELGGDVVLLKNVLQVVRQ